MAGSGITMSWGETLDAYLHRIEQLWVPATAAASSLPARMDALQAALSAQTHTINTLAGLIQAGGAPDVQPLVDQINQLTQEVSNLKQAEADQTTLIEQLKAELSALAPV